MGGSDKGTFIAFGGIVLIGGMNAVAIKFSNLELAPFWGAALRFGIAALLLGGVVVYRRLALPRGRALLGSVLYGFLNFGVSYAMAYWGLQTAPASLAMIVMALVPLLTLILAAAHRVERLRAKSLAGSVTALLGVVIVFGDGLDSDPTLLMPIAAFLIGALAIAETNVVVKGLPRSHPVVNNALAMGIGAALLFGVALIAAEPLTGPTQSATIAALAYLVLLGSIGLFMLFLYVIERWTATATSYTLLLMPFVTMAGAAILVGEPVRPLAVVGGALVVLGVYVGAFSPSLRLPMPGLFRSPGRAPRAAAEPTLEVPCS